MGIEGEDRARRAMQDSITRYGEKALQPRSKLPRNAKTARRHLPTGGFMMINSDALGFRATRLSGRSTDHVLLNQQQLILASTADHAQQAVH